MNWRQAMEWQALEQAGRGFWRDGGRQVALFLVDGQVYAVDNRCPHEGYPLREGDINAESCVLTCKWHNWKFDLKSGVTILGADRVRVYPTRVEDGFVWVDVSEPSAEERQAAILEDLEVAMAKLQYGRIAREVSRLLVHGLEPFAALRRAIQTRAEHFEFGMTHAYAAAADWAELAAASSDQDLQVVCLTEGIEHIAFDTLRAPRFPYPEGREPFAPEAFLAAIEAEDEARAVALVRGAIADGQGWNDLEHAFSQAALAHYNDFGHSLIYVQKVGSLLQLLGDALLPSLVLPLIRSLCQATREDLLPEFSGYAGALAQWPSTMGLDDQSLDANALWQSSVKQAMRWTLQHAPTASPHAIFSTLLQANARNLLHFDTHYQDAYDKPVAHNIGWLDFTHALTFANALWHQCQKFPSLWPQGLLQLACFVGRNKQYIDPSLDAASWQVSDPDAFMAETIEEICDHGVGVPIFSAHILKTSWAVRDELTRACPQTQQLLLSSLNRYLHTPVKMKHTRRLARQALSLVSKELP